jgi:ribosomal protein S18 acetylase RimI-like enzyme
LASHEFGMLRLEPYSGDRNLDDIFCQIFDETELPYLRALLHDGVSKGSFIGLDEKGVQAFILVHETPEGHADYEISFLGVSAQYRKNGYAERLLQMTIVALNGASIWLQVLKDNDKACKLYTKMGFDLAEEFTTSSDETGLLWFYGVAYLCSSCNKQIVASQTLWTDGTPFCVDCYKIGDI